MIVEMQPDLVVLNESAAGLRTPGVDDVAVLKQIRRDVPSAIVIVLTQAASAQRRLTFLQAGAHHCLEASRSLDELFRAIQDMSAMTTRSYS
jgi:DNA-binding NarL/FixJ family response regulator